MDRSTWLTDQGISRADELSARGRAREMERLALLTREDRSESARLAMDLCAGRYDRVIGALGADTRSDVDDRDDYLAIAYTERAASDPARVTDLLSAVDRAARAVQLRPESVRSRANHATTLENLALYDSARAAWRRAIELAPEGGPARRALGGRLASLDAMLEEVRAHDRALESLDVLRGRDVRGVAARAPDLAFRRFEEQFLARWAALVPEPEGESAGGESDEVALLAIGSALAAAIADRGDTSLQDILAELAAAEPMAARDAVASFGRAVERFRALDLEGAAALLAPALPALRAISPTLAARAEFYLARCQAQDDGGAAARRFARLFDDTPDRHAFFKGQNAWFAALNEQGQRHAFEALAWARRAEPFVERGAGARAAAMALVIAAAPLESLGRFEESWRNRLTALRAIMPSEDHWQKHALLVNSGFGMIALGMTERAVPFFDEAVSVAASWTANPVAHAEVLTQRAKVAAELGRFEAARRDIEEARAIFVGAGVDQSWNLLELQVAEGLAWTEEDPARAVSLLEEAYFQQASRGEHFELLPVSLAQAKSLRRLGRPRDAAAQLSRAIAAVEGLAAATASLASSELKQLTRHLGKLRAEQLELALEMDLQPSELLRIANHTHTPSLRLPAPPVAADFDLAQFQENLDGDELVLVITPSRDSLLHFVIRRDGVDVVRTPVTEPSTLPSPAASWDRYFAPVADALVGRRLHLVLHGSLSHLPLHLALDPTTAQPLIEDHEVSFWPTLEILGAAHSRGAPRTGPMRLSASPGAGADPERLQAMGLAALPFAAMEVEQVRRLYGPAEPIEPFTPERLGDALRTTSVVHYAGHAILRSTDYRDAALVLQPSEVSPEGLFDIDRVRALQPLAARVVVLSACETALGFGKEAAPEWGLPAELLRAGAGFVLATVSPLDDREEEATAPAVGDSFRGGASEPLVLRVPGE